MITDLEIPTTTVQCVLLTDLAAAPTIAKLNEILKHANIDSVLQGSQWNNFE